ncbi:hypothetical protein HM003_04610 [Candidatus Bathyarchaeota archaeon A05DMB-5]|nr:hypothetical protein [Candidatus Bathyarchaeota archaeon A05DMB-5]
MRLVRNVDDAVKTIKRVVLLLLLLFSLVWVSFCFEWKTFVSGQSPKIITVGVGGDFGSIQEAINAAENGDTVLVYAGVYFENVVVNKSVSLVGEGWESTVVDGGGSGHVVLVEADNVTVCGFTLRNSGVGPVTPYSGISLNFSDFCLVCNNSVVGNEFGVWFSNSANNTFFGNVVAHNSGIYGVRLYGSSGNNLSCNRVFDNGYGVYLYAGSDGNVVKGNVVSDNSFGVYVAHSTGNVIEENVVANSSMYGVTLRLAGGNVLFHNDFVGNHWQFDVSDASANVWDDGFPSGGNFWSDFLERYPNATEIDASGVWDTAYFMNSGNVDLYPLVRRFNVAVYGLTVGSSAGGSTMPAPGVYNLTEGSVVFVHAVADVGFSFDYWLLDGVVRRENPVSVVMDGVHVLWAFFVDDVAPLVGVPVRVPSGDVEAFVNVTVSVSVVDFGSGVCNVSLWFRVEGAEDWVVVGMSHVYLNDYEGFIPGFADGTRVEFKVVAFDNAGNVAVNDDGGVFFKYSVVWEFSSFGFVLLFMGLSLFLLCVWKRKVFKRIM